MSDTPRISDCRDVDVHDAVYDPASRELVIDFTPGERASLAVSVKGGKWKPVDVSRPGERRRFAMRFSK
jgi:hypothetical protein